MPRGTQPVNASALDLPASSGNNRIGTTRLVFPSSRLLSVSRPLRITLATLAVIAGLVAIAFVAGSVLPREHIATSTVTLRAPVDSVWAVVRDFRGMPAWWDELRSSERVTAAGTERWRQNAGGFQMELDVVTDSAPALLVTRIAGAPGAPFGGTWTYALVSVGGGGTVVTVTENGWIGPPPFRLMGRVFGLHATIDGFLIALGRRFGETVTPVHEP
jgi:uncharacterized protein YndB with AHSA1/START domain